MNVISPTLPPAYMREDKWSIVEPTPELRWFCNEGNLQPILQQRWQIRNIVNQMLRNVEHEWRDVPTVESA